jgi:sterol desaturase/sphingolipid hydroxylase (fatty acid hydroxylase superfamily)
MVAAPWVVFVAAFLLLAMWESARPRRRLLVDERRRWRGHAVILAIGATPAALIFQRTVPLVVAATVADSRFGLLSHSSLPFPAQWVLAVLLLDLVKYAMHRAHHSIPWLWRVHQVHHSDPDLDVSTAGRFHPLETVTMQAAQLAAIAVLAPPPSAVLFTLVVAAFHTVFAHANASLPAWLERPLRTVLVTPDIHGIHHSEEMREQSRNFGDVFPWWDRALRTYASTPARGPEGLIPGLRGFQDERSVGIGFMLALPFRRPMPVNAGATRPVTISP